MATLILSLAACDMAGAQEPGVALQLGASVLEVGETIDAQLICTNTGQPAPPQYVVPPGLEIEVASPNPMQSSMTSIINGRTTHRSTYTFALRIVGKSPGAHTIGPIRVDADGQTYQTEPVSITVKQTEASPQAEGDQLAFVKIAVEPQSLYVSQTIRAALTIAIRRVYLQGQLVDYDQLLQTIDARGSNLSMFGPRFVPSEMTIADSTGKRHQYLVYRDTKEIRADQVGTMEIGPVFLKVNYPTAFRRSFWGLGVEPSRSTRVNARAEAVQVTVKAPPAAGRPSDFTGAIGQFTIAASAKPEKVQQGQPVTLTVSIQGSPIEGVAGPDLAAQPELVSRFEFSAEELTGDVEQNAKVFRRAIFPKQPGEQTIPSISWSYFDATKERYVTLKTSPIPIIVDAAPHGQREFTAASDGSPTPTAASLTLLRGGISPNYVAPAELLANQAFAIRTTPLAIALSAPPLFALLAVFVARRRAQAAGDSGFLRRRHALRAGRQFVSQALRQKDPASQLSGLASAMTNYLSDRYNLPPGTITPDDARELIATRSKDETVAEQVAEFLADCDAIRYAPSLAKSVVPQEASARVRRWMSRIERNGT